MQHAALRKAGILTISASYCSQEYRAATCIAAGYHRRMLNQLSLYLKSGHLTPGPMNHRSLQARPITLPLD